MYACIGWLLYYDAKQMFGYIKRPLSEIFAPISLYYTGMGCGNMRTDAMHSFTMSPAIRHYSAYGQKSEWIEKRKIEKKKTERKQNKHIEKKKKK